MVVVLIIAVLSAVALPLYMSVVERSRAVEALLIVNALKKGEDMHYLASGTYTLSFSDLPVSPPSSTGVCRTSATVQDCSAMNHFTLEVTDAGGKIFMLGARRKDNSYLIRYQHSDNAVFCISKARKRDSLCRTISKSNTPQTISGQDHYYKIIQ